MKYQDKIVLKGTTDFKSFPRPCILLMTAAKNVEVGVGLSTTQLTSGKMGALTKKTQMIIDRGLFYSAYYYTYLWEGRCDGNDVRYALAHIRMKARRRLSSFKN